MASNLLTLDATLIEKSNNLVDLPNEGLYTLNFSRNERLNLTDRSSQIVRLGN